jgi:hypothetical protein
VTEKLATLVVFNNEREAELARSRLEQAGIDAIVVADDGGGMLPQFQSSRGVKLQVRSEDLQSARELLGV